MIDPKTQVDLARHAVLAVHRTDLATLVVTGKDRLSWLNGLLTCDLTKREPGDAMYGLAVGRNGRVLSDATVVVDDPGARVMLAVPAAAASALREHLDHYLVMEDAEIAPGAGAFDVWALHGPRADEVLDAARAAGALAGRVDRTGFGGAILLAPTRAPSHVVREALERAIDKAGGAVGDDVGWEALRLERAVPRFGVDFDERTYPQEASLEKAAVSFEKGCYLGQEVVFMLEKRGHVKRKLAALVVDMPSPPERGAAVSDPAGLAVGEVTSAEWSPTLGKAVALAMLKRAYTSAGTQVTVAGASAEVVERPA
jgi:folate-binding protein YgfZ